MDSLWPKVFMVIKGSVAMGIILSFLLPAACSNRPAGDAGSTQKGKRAASSQAIGHDGKGRDGLMEGPGEKSGEIGDFEEGEDDGERDD